MQRGKKIAAAVVMLSLGFGTAMLFRRTDTPASADAAVPPTPQKEALVLRESHREQLSDSLGKSAIPLLPAKKSQPPRELDTPLAAPGKTAAPPDLPAIFDRSLATPASNDSRGVAALAQLDALAARANLDRSIPQGRAELRVHRIVDGDTLGRLAERFLGDANRSEEIYALNESQLPDPNILPIGVELKIPPREGSLVVQTNRPLSFPATESARSPVVNSPLYVAPLPTASDSGGLVPVPAGQPHE